VLERIAAELPDGRARSLVEANLHDERAVPAPHLALFDDFADAVGAVATPATPAAAALVALYTSMAGDSAVAALAAVSAYEVQAPAIAASKAEGLRTRYGVEAGGTYFWDVHAGVDEAHGTWMLEALGDLTESADAVVGPATAAADAWWSFLDEREAAAPLSLVTG
jgi:pyrroloquinoline quinone (PQQ) biosynthesis protein C